jgi:glycosyltransferase involved in cell wall biosynthesis
MKISSARPPIRTEPALTVLLPVWNAMPFLPEAVESILRQSFENFVLFAIDDGSTDGSIPYLKTVTDPRVKTIAGMGHQGLGSVLNRGLELTTTPLVARMDGDDICEPDRFERQVGFLESHPTIGALGTQFTYLGRDGRTGFGRSLPLDHASIVRGLRTGELTLIHASLMMRTADVRAIGGYRFDGVGEDWDMFLRLAEQTQFANLSERSYYYRVHEGNASRRARRFTQHRIRYACRCAAARMQRIPEPSEDEFHRELERRRSWAKMLEVLDDVSLARYVAGRNMVLTGRSALGYLNLVLGAAIGPWRLLSRLRPARRRRTP